MKALVQATVIKTERSKAFVRIEDGLAGHGWVELWVSKESLRQEDRA